MPPSLIVELLRRDDFVAVEVELHNLRIAGSPPRLVRKNTRRPAHVVFRLPPQHIMEEAFVDRGDGWRPGPVPIRAVISGASRLVFKLPTNVRSVPYSLEALIDLLRLEPSLARNALPVDATSGSAPEAPEELQTAIELPTALLLSPDRSGRWTYSTKPVVHGGRSELWHARLMSARDNAGPFVRAIWRRDLALPGVMTVPLTDQDRDDIVHLSSDFSRRLLPPPDIRRNTLEMIRWRTRMALLGIPLAYVPKAIEARRLLLSSLGGSALLNGAWEYPIAHAYPPINLQRWQHVATEGRDHYVRTVRRGFLCPTGHRASFVTITERQFKGDRIGAEETADHEAIWGAVAYLRQWRFIVVQEPERNYAAIGGAFAKGGREMPLRRIRLITTETPKLQGGGPSELFFPSTASQAPFRFQLLAEDWGGRQVKLDAPLMFVPLDAKGEGETDEQFYSRVVQMYNASPSAANRKANLDGQQLAFADAQQPADTSLKTVEVFLKAQFATRGAGLARGSPWFLPEIESARVRIPAVDQLLGQATDVSVTLDPTYLDHGFDAGFNKGEVFAAVAGAERLAFAAQKSGGLARPDASIAALSRLTGPVANAAAAKAGSVDPNAFDVARLLGTIPLKEVLEAVPFDRRDLATASKPFDEVVRALDDPRARIKLPVLKSTPSGDDPTAIETRFVWKPALKEEATFGIVTLNTRGTGGRPPAELVLTGRMLTRPGTAPSIDVQGEFRRLRLEFKDAVSVTFDVLAFTSRPGQKLDVTAKGFDIAFIGALKFVDTIRSILPSDGFSDPPFLNVTGEGVTAGYTLGVPTLGVGVFSLQNLALSAALTLPFVDKPAGVRFAISDRHHPFLVTVMLFGGGGFFALALNANGIEQVEAAIEFGANVCLDLGVASGGVEIMAGVYFSMTGTSVQLTGYLRCGGHLEVLGIMAISVTFYMALSYRAKAGGKGEVWGQASLSVSVKIAFISASVTLSIERRFAGAAGDPTFDEVVSSEEWAEYCDAFA